MFTLTRTAVSQARSIQTGQDPDARPGVAAPERHPVRNHQPEQNRPPAEQQELGAERVLPSWQSMPSLYFWLDSDRPAVRRHERTPDDDLPAMNSPQAQ